MSITNRIKKTIDDLVKSDDKQPLPMNLISWLFVVTACFISAGGIYSLLNSQFGVIPTQAGYLAFWPNEADFQTVFEALGSTILNMFSVVGMYLSYRSTTILYDKRRAQLYLGLGVLLLLMGVFGHNYIYDLKINFSP